MPGGSAQGARIRCWAVFGGCRTLDPPLGAPGLLLPLHQVDHGGLIEGKGCVCQKTRQPNHV